MARIFNLILPGSGLILLRKEWFGLSVALLFSICGNIAIAGALIAPEAIPTWLTAVAACLTVIVWLFSQFACRRQSRHWIEMRRRLAELLAEAKAATERGDAEAAQRALDSAAMLDCDKSELRSLVNIAHA